MYSNTLLFLEMEEFDSIRTLGQDILPVFVSSLASGASNMDLAAYEKMQSDPKLVAIKKTVGFSKPKEYERQFRAKVEKNIELWLHDQQIKCVELSSEGELSIHEQTILEECCPLLGIGGRITYKAAPVVKSADAARERDPASNDLVNATDKEGDCLIGETLLMESA